jgi:hypothetical protein
MRAQNHPEHATYGLVEVMAIIECLNMETHCSKSFPLNNQSSLVRHPTFTLAFSTRLKA